MPPRAILLLLIALGNARAGTHRLALSLRDYVHTAWTQHDGISLSSVNDITQTTDGYLWIVTSEEGLLRFDGVRFVPMPSPCPLPGIVTQAQSDRAGGLWILCGYRLYHRDSSGQASAVQQTLMPPDLRPAMRMYVDSRRRLWLWGLSAFYLRPDQSQGPPIPGTERPSGATNCRFMEDTDGSIWLSTATGLQRIRDDRAETMLTGQFMGLAGAGSGGVYATQLGSVKHVHPNGSISTLAEIAPDIELMSNTSMAETKSGIWMGTRKHGVALLRGGRVETFGVPEGLSSGSVTSVLVDREGTVWVATPLGLHRFREPLAYLMPLARSGPPGQVTFLFQDSRNGLWLGSSDSAVRIDRDTGAKEKFDSDFLSIGEDKAGRIWLGSAANLGYLQGRRFVPVRDANGSPVTNVFAIRTDDQGQLWALSNRSGLYRIVNDRPVLEKAGPDFSTDFLVSSRFGIWIAARGGTLLRSVGGQDTTFNVDSGLTGGSIWSLYETQDSVWVGSLGGLSRWRNGQWTSWTANEGLPGRGQIFEIIGDAQDRLWLMSEGGILVLSRSQLDKTPDGQPHRLAFLRIGSLDRVVPHRGGIGTSPRVIKDRDGRLLFATFDSVAVVDPAQLNESSFMPPIVLETVLVNRRPLPQGAEPRFAKPEDIQFEYTSLSLRNPENVRFRYRLENYDKDWVEAGTQRRALYVGLRPGSYRFRVIGSGSEGVWNETGASYAFQIAAPFYEKAPFILAVLGALSGLIWMMYAYRLRLAADRIQWRMEAQAGERLRIAQDMHDSFLQGIQGSALLVQAAMEHMEEQPAETRRLLERAMQMVSHSTEQARHMLTSLRSPTPSREPLAARVESMAAQETAFYKDPPQVSIESSGAARELRPEVDEDVFLIATEALKNALRHANARKVRLAIQFTPAAFQLRIEDDGVGILPEIQQQGRSGHFGLPGMRERAERHTAVLTIKSRKGQGTELVVSLAAGVAYR